MPMQAPPCRHKTPPQTNLAQLRHTPFIFRTVQKCNLRVRIMDSALHHTNRVTPPTLQLALLGQGASESPFRPGSPQSSDASSQSSPRPTVPSRHIRESGETGPMLPPQAPGSALESSASGPVCMVAMN